jgi:nuclear cap-binding protein subunit 1
LVWAPTYLNVKGCSVLELPVKIPYFASLFVVANARKPDIGKDILDFSVTKVKEVLEQGDFVKGKLMLRFLAGLGRIIEEEGIIQVIEELVSKIEGQEANVCTSLKSANDSRGRIIWRD